MTVADLTRIDGMDVMTAATVTKPTQRSLSHGGERIATE